MKKLIGKIRFRDVLYLVGVSFSLCIFGNLLLSFFLDITDNPITEALNNTSDEGKFLWLIASIVFIAPIIEEIIFRGFLLWLFSKITKNMIVAIIAQAILFGVAHMNLVQGIYAAAAGIVLGYIRVHYETLLSSIIVHLLMNVNSIIFGFILIGITDPKEKLFVVLVTFVIFGLCMYRIINNNEEVI